MPHRLASWLFLALLPLRLAAQDRPPPSDTLPPPADSAAVLVPDSAAVPDAAAVPDSAAAPDSAAVPVPGEADLLPLPPGVVEMGAPRGYDVHLHGVQGFDIGHVNRVDGVTPSFGLTLLSVRPNVLPTLDLTLGLRSNRLDEPWYRVAASQTFADLDRLRLGAELFSETQTTDAWKVGARENDVWLFGFRTDLRNYYDARGARLTLASSDLRPWGLALSLLTERNSSMSADGFFTLTTIFGDDEDFRPNPAIRQGRITSATLEMRLLTASTQSPSLRVPGWNLTGALEHAGSALGGDLGFWRATAHLRRYSRLGERHWLNARVYATGPVAGTDSLPPQRFTYLGGAGSLPGFDTLELAGDRGVLGTVEYDVQLPTTSWSSRVFLLWQLEIFSNVGNTVARADRARLYSDLRWDAGAGVSGVTVLGYLGVFVAQRLSHLHEVSSGPRVFFRLQRTF